MTGRPEGPERGPTLLAAGLLAATFLAATFLAAPAPAAAQIQPSAPSILGLGNNGTALASRFAAISANPARLALPDGGGFSLAVPLAQLQAGLDPITLTDLSDFGGEVVPTATKEEWLASVEDAGAQRGTGGLGAVPLAFTVGRIGFQLSSTAVARGNLSPDATELILFGNAGRTGTAGDFELEGSSLDVHATSTAAVSYAFPVVEATDRTIAMGVTGKYTMGHFLVLGRDAGSLLESDPLTVGLDFPVLHTRTQEFTLNNGSGFGMDLAAAWQGPGWKFGVNLHDVFNTFEWDEEELSFRAGTARFDAETRESNFEEMPATDAPEELLDEIGDSGFDPALSLGAAYDLTPDVTLTLDHRTHLGEGLRAGPDTRTGVGAEYRALPVVDLRAGVSRITDGVQLGGGAALGLGPLNLSAAALLQRGDAGSGSIVVVGVSFGGY